jgi:hypothetical protein
MLSPAMKLGLVSCLLLLGAQAPVAPAATQPTAPASLEQRFELSLVSGLALMEEHGQAQDWEQARDTGRALLGMRSFDGWRESLKLETDSWWHPVLDRAEWLAEGLKLSFTPTEEAHVHFALGVVFLEAEDGEQALSSFQTATARAGPGELRQDATYNSGTIALLSGENWRSQLPELGGSPAAPPVAAPVAPGAPPVPEEEAPDPLEEARTAYLVARDLYIRRLRLDWRDGDTRANMELVMRRLHELDEIERKREEEEEQEEEKKDEESEDSEEENSEEEKDKSEEDSEEDQQSDSDEEPDEEPSDGEEEDEEEPEEEEEPEPSDEEDPTEEENSESEQAEQQELEPQEERFLTKEEVQRLLDRLKEHEAQGQALRDRRRQQRRPTSRDW